MRLGRRRIGRPTAWAGYGLMALGGIILLLSLPLQVWGAAAGGLLTYLGYSVRTLR